MQGISFYYMLYILFIYGPNKVLVAVSKTKLLWFPRRLDFPLVWTGKPFVKEDA